MVVEPPSDLAAMLKSLVTPLATPSWTRALHDWYCRNFKLATETESKSRLAYFISQAKMRAAIAVPICITFVALYLQSVLDEDPRKLTVLVGCTLIATYAITTLVLAQRQSRIPPWAHIVTILFDNAAITACVGVTGAPGEILIWLFLFITLGNGFRFGPAFLHVCQGASLCGLTVIFAFSEHWRINLHQWLGVVLTMIVVPAYADGLLRKLQFAIRRAEDASRAKSNFLARMSHELRTPLNGMLAAADLLRESQLTSNQQQLANIIRQAGRVLLEEIRDVLDISKIEANEISLEITSFRLSELLDEVQAVLSQAAVSRGISFTVHYDEQARRLISGDSHHLRQVIMNLAGNAIKFTGEGGVKVVAATTSVASNELLVQIAVDDTGIGIPAEKLQHIFEPFRQADESTTRKYGGTGLGLSIARQLVRLMGGDIEVNSEVGRGTQFGFSLHFPIDQQGDFQLRELKAPAPSKVNIDGDDDSLVLSPLQVLVADDNETNREVMRLMLEKDGHKVQLAIDGEEALLLLTEGQFDLAILDHNMPRLSGLDAIRLYRTASSAPIPTLIASADATAEAVAESASAGAADHLCKPVILETLRAALRRHAPRGHLRPSRSIQHRQVAPVPQIVSQTAKKQVFDEVTLERRVGLSSDPSFGGRLVDGYLHDVEQLRDEIHAAISRRDLGRVRDAAHALKGGSATIGAIALFEYSKRLQTTKESDLFNDRLQLLSELNLLVAETSAQLCDFIQQRERVVATLS